MKIKLNISSKKVNFETKNPHTPQIIIFIRSRVEDSLSEKKFASSLALIVNIFLKGVGERGRQYIGGDDRIVQTAVDC